MRNESPNGRRKPELGVEQRVPSAARTVLSNAKRVNTNPPRLVQGTAPEPVSAQDAQSISFFPRFCQNLFFPPPPQHTHTHSPALLPPKSCHHFLHLSFSLEQPFQRTISFIPSINTHLHQYPSSISTYPPLIVYFIHPPSIHRSAP